jgi:hypothetical protein
MDERQVPSAPAAERWMRVDTYIVGLARRRQRITRSLRLTRRSEPESPRLMLSTLPFAALLSMLAVLFIAIAIAAWPPSQPGVKAPSQEPPPTKLGNAPRGWFQEAAKEFR